MLTRRSLFVLLFAIGGVVAGGTDAGLPWDKAPEQWTLADVYRILQKFPVEPRKIFPGIELHAAHHKPTIRHSG